jgi:pimeloyl-ACP methyl ester carboxylesterase
MIRLVRSLASAIPTARTQRIAGAGHAAPFDATANFVQLIADTIIPEDAVATKTPGRHRWVASGW